MTLVPVTIEKKESFPKNIDHQNYFSVNLHAIVSTEKIFYNKYLLHISASKAYELHCLEPILIDNLEHLNIYSDFDPLSSPTL